MVVIIIDIIGFHIEFASQSRFHDITITVTSGVGLHSDNLTKKLPSGGSHHLDKRLSKWSPLLHNMSKDYRCRPRIFIINSFCYNNQGRINEIYLLAP